MGKPPLLSVCLITYNHAPYIKEAIESILAQKINFTWELVIADDYSTDGTRDILLEYQKKFPKLIKLIFQKQNVGPESNWLDLISYPKSKYIAYLEGDDYWTDEQKLQTQVDFLEKNPDYVLCFHPARIFFENSEERETIWPLLPKTEILTTDKLLKENFIPSNSAVYRRQDYSKLRRGVMPGDWYFHLYHAQFGKIRFIHKIMSAYRRHEDGAWWNHYQDKELLWKKYGLAMLALHTELLKLYGKNKTYRSIIQTSVSEVLNNLIRLDQKNNEKLLKKALADFPSSNELFLTSQYEGMKHKQRMFAEQEELLQQKNQEIDDKNKDVLDLRVQVFKLRDELHTLKGSRVIGRIIKYRGYVGSTLIPGTKQLPHRALGKTKRITKRALAKVLPHSHKKYLRETYDSMDGAKRNVLKNYHERRATTKTIAIEPWQKGYPLVSVVIPYYNRADTIDDTLHSLDAQTFTNFEAIIVDDGSTDPESIEKLHDLKNKGLKARIIRQENQGVAAARNHGIEQAKGKYVVCLDSDDMLAPTFIEKSTVLLESHPDVSLVTTHRDDFGVLNEHSKNSPYDPLHLYGNNMIITAAEFQKKAWQVSGGYTSGIGYEDWEYWLSLAEHGFWGRLIPEPLFKYRTSLQSRYVENKDIHWHTIKAIRALHPKYKKNVRALLAKRQYNHHAADPNTALINMDNPADYPESVKGKFNILITIPWMTFGGAETLIYNFCREIKDVYTISFVTGLSSAHEWEYKFREITPSVYHLANLFEDPAFYVEFISNYIKTRKVDVLHIIHNGFTFDMLAELKTRHPRLKVAVTVFNDRVEYFDQSVKVQKYIDAFVTDNSAVAEHYSQELKDKSRVSIIPNGIDCYDEFNPKLFDRVKERTALDIRDNDLAIFFVGRLSEEKNPDVFIETAHQLLETKKLHNLKFFIIGDGPLKPQVEKALKSVNSKNITYLGYQAEVAKYLSVADIFVLPSSIEGFPLSILEAMAMEAVVVASDVGAVAEVVGEDGFVVPAASKTDIANAITTLSTKPELLEELKAAARTKVEQHYSNRVLGDNYKKLYTGLKK